MKFLELLWYSCTTKGTLYIVSALHFALLLYIHTLLVHISVIPVYNTSGKWTFYQMLFSEFYDLPSLK